jgi:hypothetical protein
LGDQNPAADQFGIASRLQSFCNWMISKAKPAGKEPGARRFVVVGHSEWLFDFYTNFLTGGKKTIKKNKNDPVENPLIKGMNQVEKELTAGIRRSIIGRKLKKQKLGNAGVIHSKIQIIKRDDGKGVTCRIAPGSTILLTADSQIKISGD